MTTFRPKFRRCSVLSCLSKNEPGITYHRFPNEPTRRREWLKVLAWKESQVHDRSAVCSKHFRLKDYYPGLNRVYLHAVPSLKLNKDKGKSKPNKMQTKKDNEKQSRVKKRGCKPQSLAESKVLNAKKTLANTSPLIKPNLGTKCKYLKSQSLSRVSEQENIKKPTRMLSDKIDLDSSRKLLSAKQSNINVKKNLTICEMMKMGADAPHGTGTLTARSANSGRTSHSNAGSTNSLGSPNLNMKRRTTSTSDSDKAINFKTKMMKNKKENDQKVFSKKSNSKNTSHREDERNSMEYDNLVEFGDSETIVASPKSTEADEKYANKTFDKLNFENCDNTFENVLNLDDDNFDKTDDENVDKTEKVNETDDDINISKTDYADENVDKTDYDEEKDEKTDDEEFENSSSENEKKKTDKNCDIRLLKTDSEQSDKTKNGNNFQKSDDNYVAEADITDVGRGNIVHSTIMKENSTLKRSPEAKSAYPVNKRKRFKRKRLISTSSQDSNEAANDRNSLHTSSKSSLNGRSSKRVRRVNRKSRRSIQRRERSNSNLYNIEQIISEMQKKIQNLERKSILDERKIETFKKALIEQRDNDIKLLMDEKENELLLRMDLLYLNYDPQRICRLCLLLVDRKEMLTSLFKSEPLISLIKNATGVQIEPEDGMPCGICDECLQQMKRVDWIKRKTQKSNDLINKFVSMKKSMTDTRNFSSSPSMINVSDSLFEEELSDTFKIEDVFSLEAATTELLFVKEEPLSDDEEDKKPFWSEDFPVVDFKTKLRLIKKCKKCFTLFTNSWTFKKHIKYCNCRFQCSECSKRFWNSHLLKCHKRRMHSCMSEWRLRHCQECDICFRWKHQLLFHIIQHTPVSCEL